MKPRPMTAMCLGPSTLNGTTNSTTKFTISLCYPSHCRAQFLTPEQSAVQYSYTSQAQIFKSEGGKNSVKFKIEFLVSSIITSSWAPALFQVAISSCIPLLQGYGEFYWNLPVENKPSPFPSHCFVPGITLSLGQIKFVHFVLVCFTCFVASQNPSNSFLRAGVLTQGLSHAR